ncbi:MAG: hypothetical protein HY611_06095 [Elusimicrobia bacterium]|nr:hypothetical protein [Elusimicrobiota bacterium]
MNPELLLFGRDSGSAGEAAGVIYKRRLLPVEGEVLVRAGDRVRAADAVAQAALPGKFHLLPAAARLGVAPGEIRKFLRKNTG